jgi:signal transduction histidine kinase
VFAVAIGGYGRFEVVPLATDSIVEEIDAGVLAYDAQGRVLDANRNAVRALGAPDPAGEFLPALLAGADSVTLDTDGDLETLEARLDGHEFTAEEDGRRRRYSASVSEIHDPACRAAGRALLLYDVTKQYRRQQQLERANERLEQFADVVSHDLRNPLHVASGHLELAREGRTESFDEVEAALERIDEIVENVLTLARQGEAIGETEPVSLERVAREAWSHVPTGDATLSVVTDATVQADRDRLVQLFENLFRNSLDHAGSDVAVTVGATDVLYVEDDGPGIPAGERESVFESGYTTGAGNTGLGLAIVAEIADAHGWEVRVTEGADGGARFEFDGPAFE